MKFRAVKADEIDVRVGTVNQKGCSLLLYKDARCDMNILDETVGAMNWKREHLRDNANCVVSIWDAEKKQWISKEDTGKESYTEKEKGLASDSFKRACVNWGIGRELYTAPFIWINSEDAVIEQNSKGGFIVKTKFKVDKLTVKDGRITELVIMGAKQYEEYKEKFRFCEENHMPMNATSKYTKNTPKNPEKIDALNQFAKEPPIDYRQKFIDLYRKNNLDFSDFSKKYKLVKESTQEEFRLAYESLKKELNGSAKGA